MLVSLPEMSFLPSLSDKIVLMAFILHGQGQISQLLGSILQTSQIELINHFSMFLLTFDNLIWTFGIYLSRISCVYLPYCTSRLYSLHLQGLACDSNSVNICLIALTNDLIFLEVGKTMCQRHTGCIKKDTLGSKCWIRFVLTSI